MTLNRLLKIFFILLIASVLRAGAFALSEGLFFFDADAEKTAEYDYTPASNSEYAFCVYAADSEDADVSAELWSEGVCLARGQGLGELFSCRLTAGRACRVVLRGQGRAAVELTRHTRGRCPALALELREDSFRSKRIAQTGDAHWYGFEAGHDGVLLLSCLPDAPGLKTRALLFDGDLTLVTDLGTALRTHTEAGRRYYVRVDAPDGGTGSYTLGLNRGSLNEALRFEADGLELAVGESDDLRSRLRGEALLFTVSDPSVCAVSNDGVLTALRAGEAVVTASDAATDAELRVTVRYIPLTGLSLPSGEIRLSEGDSADIYADLTPENASDKRLLYIVDDERIACVDESGVLRALAAGDTALTVMSPSTGLTAQARVSVTEAPRRYRALLVAEEHYPAGHDDDRPGAIRSMEVIGDLLHASGDGEDAYSVRTERDLDRSEFICALREMRSASDKDLTLVYLSCHGVYRGGMSFFELSDGTLYAARDLERELRAIPGRIVLLLDCCASGGAIGKSSGGPGTALLFPTAAIRGTKYAVIAGCALDEDSLRVSFRYDGGETPVSTLFARVFCEGAGRDIDTNERAPMRADTNTDGELTFSELAAYMAQRMGYYTDKINASGTRVKQSIQAVPETDATVLLRRG